MIISINSSFLASRSDEAGGAGAGIGAGVGTGAATGATSGIATGVETGSIGAGLIISLSFVTGLITDAGAGALN